MLTRDQIAEAEAAAREDETMSLEETTLLEIAESQTRMALTHLAKRPVNVSLTLTHLGEAQFALETLEQVTARAVAKAQPKLADKPTIEI